MKLRTQFALLVIGVIVVPFLTGALVPLLGYSLSGSRAHVPDYVRIYSWLRYEAPRAIGAMDFSGLLKSRPADTDFVILSRDDSIVFSTMPELPAGTQAASGPVMDYMRKNVHEYHFQMDTPGPGDGDSPILVLRLPKVRPGQEYLMGTYQAIAAGMIAALVFSTAASILILRSLNRSIVALESATRRVSEGDLDCELRIRGPREIVSLAQSFEGMRSALKEEYARRSRFVMGVSHDLKTPLTLIQGYVEAIADGYASDPETQKKYLSIIKQKAGALGSMIEELIEFTKMDTGEWRMTFRPVRLKEFLSTIAKRYAQDALLLKLGFSSTLDLPEDLAVLMDEGLMGRALENIIGNALRYTEEGGRIGLTAGVAGGCVELSIADTGIGIPKDEMDRIFDPFYRGTNSRREQGFGLGLPTVKSIIEGHGWTFAVESEIEKGTTFTIFMFDAKGGGG